MAEPLAARLRPRAIEEMVGQTHLLGPDGPVRPWIAAGRLPALILVGPPGTGKTTLGRLLAEATGAGFLTLNATTDGVADLRKRLSEADELRAASGRAPVLFLDEIHRFSKSQQDGLLAAVEEGRITLVGATTENPFGGAVIPALLSRVSVLRLQALSDDDLGEIERRGLLALAEDGTTVTLDDDARRNLRGFAGGDGRRLLTILDAAAPLALAAGRTVIEGRDVARAAQQRVVTYDRSGVVSAFIKSIRGGDKTAALYWLAVQLEAGEDPRYIARRLLIAAAEEVGAADPAALPMAAAVLTAAERVGLPEIHYPLAAVTVYLAGAPRDWWPGSALHATRGLVVRDGAGATPAHLRPGARTYRHPAAVDAADQHYRPAGLDLDGITNAPIGERDE